MDNFAKGYPGKPVKAPPPAFAVKRYVSLCESLDTPVALSCWLMAKYGEWDQLVSKKLDPLDYLTGQSFRLDYLAVSVLSKAEFLPTTFDRRENARQAFWDAETQCAQTNERIELYSESRLCPLHKNVTAVLHRAREWIRRLLGDDPNTFANRAGLSPLPHRFGPGATTLVRGEFHAAQKYSRRIDVTPALYPYWHDVVGLSWARHVEDVSLRASNKVTFVPKNAKTFRTIAIEPHVNGYAQLGIAALLRRALRRAGIDLTVQADKNRYLASVAESMDLATIDLKAASDTISRSLVWLLFPEGWCWLLDTARSHYGDLDGVEFEYEKFSSMGNGFTFELETLIFTALVQALNPAVYAVFGDDIICDSAVAPELLEVLRFCGFTVNVEKTFLSGPFRESCGQDYFHGEDVRPFFWKELDVPLWWKVCNDLREFATDPKTAPAVSQKIQRVARRARESVPSYLAVSVPPGYGSFGLVDGPPPGFDPALSRLAHFGDKGGGFEGYSFRAIVFKAKTTAIHEDVGAYLFCLDGGSYEGASCGSFRKSGKWKRSWVYSLGSWPELAGG